MARPPYSHELQQLAATYEAATQEDPSRLQSLMLTMAGGPARMVGTGGTAALAQLAADLHEQISGQPARAVTPLELLQAPDLHRAGAMLFSARARHPDALLVLDRFGSGVYNPAVLMTHRRSDELQLHGDVSVVTVAPPELAEGFLATNSVMAMTVALLRAALGDHVLSAEFPHGLRDLEPVLPRERLLVLFPPSLRCVALDIETRCSELGLAAVQLSDLRNVAHGRHTGLARLASKTTVLLLSDAENGPLAEAVSAPLDDSRAEIVRWHVDLPWAPAVIVLLAASMHLTARLGESQGIDPARPRVPVWGRRLYRLPLRRVLAREPASAVERKLKALGGGSVSDTALRERCVDAFVGWSNRLAQTPLGGVVLDYDGTVCETTQRFDPPSAALRSALQRLMDGGLVLGFASGRGKSLHEGLRAWVPERHWGAVTLGLYNGAVCMSLTDELPDSAEPTPLMAEITRRLEASCFIDLVELSTRSGQVTVEARSEAFFHSGRLAALVREILARTPALPVKVWSSGHSVDVIAHETSKVQVLNLVVEQAIGDVLAVGDQGDLDGNDFELLAATPWSISVGRCSADLSRCWYVDPAGRHGPSALLSLLHALTLRDGLATLNVAHIRKRVPRA